MFIAQIFLYCLNSVGKNIFTLNSHKFLEKLLNLNKGRIPKIHRLTK